MMVLGGGGKEGVAPLTVCLWWRNSCIRAMLRSKRYMKELRSTGTMDVVAMLKSGKSPDDCRQAERDTGG